MFQHVLIVDPDPASARQLKELLLQQGIGKVTIAGRTGVGVEELRTKHKPFFDFIITNIDQPDVVGIDAVTKLREEGVSKRIPIVVTCEERDPVLLFLALKAGADEYVLKKDILSHKLLAILTIAVERRNSRLSPFMRQRLR